MTTSSAQDIYSITLDDSYSTTSLSTLTSSDVITITSSGYEYTSSSITNAIANLTPPTALTGTTILSSGGIGTISINDLNSTTLWTNTEWENSFPDWHRIQSMCEKYPGLKIAFDKFKTTYKLVKDDYDNPDNKK